MRRRLRSGMARRIGEGRPIKLTPSALRIGGWIVAALLIVGIAVVVGVLGGEADGVGASPTPGATATAAGTPIAFGTGLDETSGAVAENTRTTRFTAGDAFVYSVHPGDTVPSQVYVEVRRSAGEGAEVVQAPVEAQVLPNPEIIAFSVPANALLADFGAGAFRMLIYADPDEAPIAEGDFQLVAGAVSPAATSSVSAETDAAQ